MITILIAAAALAGQSPVTQMVSVCLQVMDSPTGTRYLNMSSPNVFDPEADSIRRAQESAFQSAVNVEASVAHVDVQQTREVCRGMVIANLQGQRTALSNMKLATPVR